MTKTQMSENKATPAGTQENQEKLISSMIYIHLFE